MDADSWSTRLSSGSKRYQLALQSDMFMGFEEIDGEDDMREEFPCPFCSEHFNIVGLCCHIDDEHPVEAKNGVCPVCAMKVGVDMVAHITLHHGNIFKMQRKRKSYKGESHSTLSLLRKELRERNLQSLLGGSFIVSSSNFVHDPFLSSFILPMVDDFVSVQPHFSWETNMTEDSSDANKSERKRRQKDASSFKECCCPQFLMIFYDCLRIVCSDCRPENPCGWHRALQSMVCYAVRSENIDVFRSKMFKALE